MIFYRIASLFFILKIIFNVNPFNFNAFAPARKIISTFLSKPLEVADPS